MNLIRGALGLLVIAFLATVAVAGPNASAMVTRMAKELDLTADQQVKLTAILDAQQQRMEARHKAFQDKVATILTPEQMKQIDIANDPRLKPQVGSPGGPLKAGPAGGPLAGLNLTDRQKAEMWAWFETQRPRMEAERNLVMAQINEVLTAGQREKMAQRMRGGFGGPGRPTGTMLGD